MLLQLALVTVLLTTIIPSTHGKLISCVCTTSHCTEQQTPTCNTTSMCFSQYLDRRDGSDPLVRGCITSKTPLLCENRRPALARLANWPVLLCCNRNLCNQDSVITPPLPPTREPDDVTTMLSGVGIQENGHGIDDVKEKIKEKTQSHFFGSVYIIVLVIGVCCLVVVGGIAMLVLRRQSSLYNPEFGHVERNGYLKGQAKEATHHRQQPTGRTYDNKVVLNT